MRLITIILLSLLFCTAAAEELPNMPVQPGPTISITDIVAVTRHDQSAAIKYKYIEKEYTLSDLFEDLEKFRVVSEKQYDVVSYSTSLTGEITLKEHGTYFWEIHPNISGVLRDPRGGKIFLLNKKTFDSMPEWMRKGSDRQ